MADAYVQRIASANGSSSGGTYSFSVATAPSAGNTIILAVRTGASVAVSSVTDSKSNTWAVDIGSTGSTGRTTFCSTQQDGGKLTTSDTITVHVSAGTSPVVAAYEVSGITTGTRFDQSAVLNSTGQVTSATVGPTGTTAQADEFVITCVGANKGETSASPSSGWTTIDSGQISAGGAALQVAYQLAEATGTFSCTWTVSALSANLSAAIATYKARVGSLVVPNRYARNTLLRM